MSRDPIATILLVDREVPIRNVLVNFLGKIGCQVLPAPNIKQARKIFHETSEKIDLLLVDKQLPDGDGFELAQCLNSRQPDLRIILTSGSPESDIPENLRSKSGFLQKPFRLDEMIEKIDELMGGLTPVEWEF